MRRIFYFFYYLYKINFAELFRLIKFVRTNYKKNYADLLCDLIYCSFKYNISILEYFYFKFYLNKEHSERNKWAGTGFMFEYQRKMNPSKYRKVLANKILFNNKFKAFIGRNYYTLKELKQEKEKTEIILKNKIGKLVLKNSKGQAGREVLVLQVNNICYNKLLTIMSQKGFDLLEEYIIQHPVMEKLSASAINTVRIITQEEKGNITIIAARLRISINSTVDNLAAGNAAAPVDIESGKVTGPAVFTDITKEEIIQHPITGTYIIGFQIPFWSDIKTLVTETASMIPENRSIGWDVAITPTGPILIEGNHNWCKLLWQLPVKKGLKAELEKYL